MDDITINVQKRNKTTEDFDLEKLSNSIMMAALGIDNADINLANEIADDIYDILLSNGIESLNTDGLMNLVKEALIKSGNKDVANSYCNYNMELRENRETQSPLMRSIAEIYSTDGAMDIKKENANVDSNTPMGAMLKVGSQSSINYVLCTVMDKLYSRAHRYGDIHVHDLEFYTITETCCQIDLKKLFENGFNTGHGFLREPASIRSAAALAAIAIQSNQNDQHGGQSIPLFDYYLAPYVALSFLNNIAKVVKIKYELSHGIYEEISKRFKEYWKEHKEESLMSDDNTGNIFSLILESFHNINENIIDLEAIYYMAYEETYDETYQAMEAFIHNLNTMHSRAGAQVPFSSINYGTDTSVEGRMIIETLLKSTMKGLGNGEIPIFPIQIFKIKAGVNFNEGDTNYDLLQLSFEVSAKRLYPNYQNLDASYNSELYIEGHPETEMATMGCRTRVGKNMHDPNKSVIPGRGNLSFTSINLPRLAILANHDIDKFFNLLSDRLELVHGQLLERFEIQCKRHPINFPFLMGQGCWLGTENLGPTDDIREALKNGTLAVGFIGLAETLTALIGKHHGESAEAQELGLKIISYMRKYTDAWSEEEKMNYSVIGTPAEGLSGRFVKMDRERFGVIEGVTDKDYYTNSSHVPVGFPISATKKIDIEAPYHELENGGHILYIELDGDPSKNIKAFEKVVRYMHDKNAGYFAINHPVDRDPVCGYVGVIEDVCPRCGRREGEPMTIEMWNKIKGYAGAPNACTCGACGNTSEESDRLPNSIDDLQNIKFQRGIY